MKKCMIYNVSKSILFIDLDGNAATDDVITLGAGAREEVSLTDKRIAELRKEFRNQITIKEI